MGTGRQAFAGEQAVRCSFRPGPEGPILLAMKSLYLNMVVEDLLGLPQEVLARLRFFGLGDFLLASIPRLAPLVYAL